MTYKENIKAILECYFTGFKEEIIDSACNRILDQEPCDDTISRFEALEALNSINGTSELDKAFEVIEELPSVTPKPKTEWISVSERLPEELKGVLVYCPTNDNIFCAYLEKGAWKIFSPIALEDIKEIVTAWMPLPEPYKAESEEV